MQIILTLEVYTTGLDDEEAEAEVENVLDATIRGLEAFFQLVPSGITVTSDVVEE